jgi:RNA polymerase sigma factor (sigma-70 family)
MRVFVAGGTGVIGRRLVPQLVACGHHVTATTTNGGKLGLLEQLGAEGVVMDGLDAASVGEAVAAARPDAIVNQMTGLSEGHAGKPNLRKADRFFATTNRLRSDGIDHLQAAAEATGVSHIVAQGHASMNGIRTGGWVKTEDDPLEVVEGTKAINHLEDVVVRAGGAVVAAALSVMAAGFQGRARMTRGEEFEQLRPLLFAIAYRILGSVAEAEDAVQETWLRYQASPTQPTSTKAYLSAVVTRVSINVLRSARVRREAYVGTWFPEPLVTDPYEDPERSAELADSVSMAALLLLERLTPLQRAVFVLREVFGFSFPEVASAVGVRRRRAASSRPGRGATWTSGALGSRRTAGNARSWRHGSSTRSGMATSTE